jgi:hypothetical protein
MTEPGNRPVVRRVDQSIYTHRVSDLSDLGEFVQALYSVGAIGNERIDATGNWEIKVAVASNDLMPRPGRGAVTMRRADHDRMLSTIRALRDTVDTLATLCVGLAILWVMS